MTHTRCWPDPTDHDKQARGEVVGDHVEGHLPGQHQLEPGGAVVHPDGLVVGVAWVQGLEGDLVIQDGLDAIVIRNKLKAILYCIVLDIKRKSYLRQEGNFTHWIVETANFELADLEIEDVFFSRKVFVLQNETFGEQQWQWKMFYLHSFDSYNIFIFQRMLYSYS